jgi:arylsulfatase A-like enzyme
MASDLDVSRPELEPGAHRELKTYVNAVRTADSALARLVAHFRHVNEKTLVVVLGDHLAGLSPSIYEALGFADGTDPRLHSSGAIAARWSYGRISQLRGAQS